jgi:hypothetical protein
MLCREEHRLKDGWTYEPPTFYETNSTDGSEAVTRIDGIAVASPARPLSRPRMKACDVEGCRRKS